LSFVLALHKRRSESLKAAEESSFVWDANVVDVYTESWPFHCPPSHGNCSSKEIRNQKSSVKRLRVRCIFFYF